MIRKDFENIKIKRNMKTKRLIIAIIGIMIFSVSYGQKVIDGGNWAVIDCSGLRTDALKTSVEVANSKTDGRLKRHKYDGGLNGNPHVNEKVSPKFAVSKSDITLAGGEQAGATMNWAQAAGWHTDANTTGADVALAATGCAQYAPTGSVKGEWRLPTQRELMLIWVLKRELEKISGFQTFYAYTLWSATENSSDASWYVSFTTGGTYYVGFKTYSNRVRCVRDL